MGNKMLIDAAHPEETRVVVSRGNKVEEFDYESAARKQLRGNIYLAKVTRVEAALQAAFVDYGGNRHGFLAFNEIHPDYYQIPVADRQALLEEEARANRRQNFENGNGAGAEEADEAELAQDEEAGEDETGLELLEPAGAAAESAFSDPSEEETGQNDDGPQAAPEADPDEAAAKISKAIPLEAVLPPEISEELAEAMARAEAARDEIPADMLPSERSRLSDRLAVLAEDTSASDVVSEVGADALENLQETGQGEEYEPGSARGDGDGDSDGNGDDDASTVEAVGSDDALEEVPVRTLRRRRTYKIQEVIKRRQILLVQVVKEERGSKGAALTTYLSLAGRYTVLMPNTASGGGISRKIASPADRKRLRQIASELDVPEGMGLIIRTAGASRTKAEIKRDFEYLLRLWENVRDLTLKSSAPCLVYEEGDLIKRSIRDLYNRDIDEVIVAGEEAYREAKDFMRMLMPSHAKNVKLYKEPEPIFLRHNIENQLDAMYSPYVTLKSGGYLVINQTEALVAIDVNSGKSTRQYSIEDTALKTNCEAAEEVARQLRLRDLAGLIVIDFIDMEERRNNRIVERKLKESLRNDRARIQIGRISAFGLLEMSRQRLRTGVLEGSTSQCPMCQGTGIVRSTETVALSVLRALEDYLRTHEVVDLTAVAANDVALYILNNKRHHLHDIEQRYGVSLGILSDERMHGSSFAIEKMHRATEGAGNSSVVVQMDWAFEPPQGKAAAEEGMAAEEIAKKRNGRRRKKRSPVPGVSGAGVVQAPASVGGGSLDEEDEALISEAEAAVAGDLEMDEIAGEAERAEESTPQKKTRRRGRRGGRRQRARREGQTAEAVSAETGPDAGEGTPETSEVPEQGAGEQMLSNETGEASVVAATPIKTSGESSEAVSAGADQPALSSAGAEGKQPPAHTPVSPPEKQSASEMEAGEPEAPQPVEPQAAEAEAPAPDSSAKRSTTRRPAADYAVSGAGDASRSEIALAEAGDEAEGGRDAAEPRRRGWWQKRAES